jgi:hypothetical protein
MRRLIEALKVPKLGQRRQPRIRLLEMLGPYGRIRTLPPERGSVTRSISKYQVALWVDLNANSNVPSR